LASFQTGWAKVIAIQLDIAQRAQKAAAGAAVDGRTFLGMIKATRLALDNNRLPWLPDGHRFEPCWIDLDLRRHIAGQTPFETPGIQRALRQGRLTFWTGNN